MNETLKTIMNRRSIRAYKKDQIQENELQTILDAGKFAPSGMNRQPWHFTVVQNEEILNKINEGCKVALQKSPEDKFNALYHAPTLIIVSCDPEVMTHEYDGALALENMFLGAESLGIGSCWIHAVKFAFNGEEGKALRNSLGIPENYTIVGSGVFGYKAVKTPEAPPRKEGIVNIVR